MHQSLELTIVEEIVTIPNDIDKQMTGCVALADQWDPMPRLCAVARELAQKESSVTASVTSD